MARSRKNKLTFDDRKNPKMMVFLQSATVFGAHIQTGCIRSLETMGVDTYRITVDVKGQINLHDLVEYADAEKKCAPKKRPIAPKEH